MNWPGKKSLAKRLLSFLVLWVILALVLTGTLLSTQFRRNAEASFQELLLAHAYNIMGAVDADKSGKLSGAPNLGDPRFQAPLSNWYWAIVTAAKPSRPLLHSASVSGDPLSVMSTEQVPFGQNFRRSYGLTAIDGSEVQRLEAQLYFGDAEELYQVIVAGSKNGLEASVAEFNRNLLIFFSLFGLGTALVSWLAVRWGLRPLDRARSALVDVRDGRADELDGEFPLEIKPLVREINGLLTVNKGVTERARTQVGNLAHALKTPLAVILNEARKPGKQSGNRITEQADLMQQSVQTYLDRARIAAQMGVISGRTPIQPVVEKLLRVMGKLNPAIEFQSQNDSLEIAFAGEQQDLEEILGNLLENAARFAESKVVLSLATRPDSMLSLVIDDDGGGINKEERKIALKRGQRLDETKPGSGLGLSIVSDIAEAYGGGFELADSALGGVSAIVSLPAISKSTGSN